MKKPKELISMDDKLHGPGKDHRIAAQFWPSAVAILTYGDINFLLPKNCRKLAKYLIECADYIEGERDEQRASKRRLRVAQASRS